MASIRMFAAVVALAASAVLFGTAAPANAADGYSASKQGKTYKRSGTRVRGYVLRGGYSYNQYDTINTYGDSRGRYGRANSFRDPQSGRQSESGPFDHGFFFDSAVTRNGGDAPYMR